MCFYFTDLLNSVGKIVFCKHVIFHFSIDTKRNCQILQKHSPKGLIR